MNIDERLSTIGAKIDATHDAVVALNTTITGKGGVLDVQADHEKRQRHTEKRINMALGAISFVTLLGVVFELWSHLPRTK